MADDPTTPNEHAEARLRNDIIGWLTTVRSSGQPDTVPVWFVWDGDTIIVYSRPNTTKIANLARNRHVSLVIDNTHGGGDVVRVDGTAEYVEDHPGAHEITDYTAKYHRHIVGGLGYADDEQFSQDYSAAIVITPTRVRG